MRFWILFFIFTPLAHASQMVITAEKVTCEKKDNTCIAETDVHVIRKAPENEPQQTPPPKEQSLRSDTLTIFFSPKDQVPEKAPQEGDAAPFGATDIHAIHAKGHVMVVNDGVTIHSDTAVYDTKTEIIEFFDDVRIYDGKTFIKSAYASMNQKTGQYEVNSSQTPPGEPLRQKSKKIEIIVQQGKKV